MLDKINSITDNKYNASTSKSVSASGKSADKMDPVFGLPGSLSKIIIEKIGECEPLAVFAEASGQTIIIRDECNEIMVTLSSDQLGQLAPDALRQKAQKLEEAVNKVLRMKYKNNICIKFQEILGKLNPPGLKEDIPGDFTDDPNQKNDGGEGNAKVKLAEYLVAFVNLKTQAELSNRDRVKVTTAMGLYQEILKWPNIKENYPRLYVEASLGLADIYSQIEGYYDFGKAKSICEGLIQDINSNDILCFLSETDRKELDARVHLKLAESLGAELNEKDEVPSPEEYQRIFESLEVAEDKFNQLKADSTAQMIKLSLERANALFQISAIYKEVEDEKAAQGSLLEADAGYKMTLGYRLSYLWDFDKNRFNTSSYIGQAKVKVSQTDQMIDESQVLNVLSQTLKDLQEKTGLSLDNLPPSVQAEFYLARGQIKVERFSVLRDQGNTDLDLLEDAMKDLEFVANNGKRRIAAQANLWLGKAYIAAAGAQENILTTKDKLNTAVSYISAALNTNGLRGNLKFDAELTQAETLIQLASIANITGENIANKDMLEKAENTFNEITKKCGNKDLVGRAYMGLVKKLLLEVNLSRYDAAKRKLETARSYIDRAKKYIPASDRAAARREEELDLISGEVLARYWLTLKKRGLETSPDYEAARKSLEKSVNCPRYSIKIDACLLLADLCSAGKEYGEAEKDYGEVLSLVKDYALSTKTELTAKAYNDLGKVYASLWEGRDYKKACDNFAAALTETAKISSPNQDKEKIYADASIGSGDIYSRLWESRDKKQAESYYEQAKKTTLDKISEEDPQKTQLLAGAQLGIANLKASQMDPVKAYAESKPLYTEIESSKEFEELDNDMQARIYLGIANLEALATYPTQALKLGEPYYKKALEMPGVEIQTKAWIKLGWANLRSRQVKLPDQVGFIYNKGKAKPILDLYKEILKDYSQDPYVAFLAHFGLAEFLATVQKYSKAISLCHSILAEKLKPLGALNKSEKRLAILKTRLLLGKVFSWAGDYISANGEYKEFDNISVSISDPIEEEEEVKLDAQLERAQYLAINRYYSEALEICQNILDKPGIEERIRSKVANILGYIKRLYGNYPEAKEIFENNRAELIKTGDRSLTKDYDPNYYAARLGLKDTKVQNGPFLNGLSTTGSSNKTIYTSGGKTSASGTYGDLHLFNIPGPWNDHLGLYATGGHFSSEGLNGSKDENYGGAYLKYQGQVGNDMNRLGLQAGYSWGVNQLILGGSFDNKDKTQISGTFISDPLYANIQFITRVELSLIKLQIPSSLALFLDNIHIPPQLQLYYGARLVSGQPDKWSSKDTCLSPLVKLEGAFVLPKFLGLPQSLTLSAQYGGKLRGEDNQGSDLEEHLIYTFSDYLAIDCKRVISEGPGYSISEETIGLKAHINFWDIFSPVRPEKK